MSLSRRDFLKVVGATAGTALVATQPALAASSGDPNLYVGMLYDATKCVGCNACTNACRQWNKTSPEVVDGLYDAPQQLSADTWTLIQLYQEGEASSFVKRQCMHCVDPACVSGCPVEALRKTAAGPVTYDADRCIGCRYCMYTCPFHVPRFQWNQAHMPEITKCTLCADRIADGNGPACAEICPTGALIWGKRGDLIADAEARIEAEPKRYVDKIYGKSDAGGTGVMYLSAVPFEKLGLPKVTDEPVPEISETVGNMFLPGIIVGGPLVLAALHSIAQRGGLDEEA